MASDDDTNAALLLLGRIYRSTGTGDDPKTATAKRVMVLAQELVAIRDAERARCLAHVRSAHRKWGNLTIGYQQAERAIESGEPADV